MNKYNDLEIVIASPELKSFCFCGGLGVMVENFAKELAMMGFSTTVIIPFYKFDVNGVKTNLDNFYLTQKKQLEVVVNGGVFPVNVYKTFLQFKAAGKKDTLREHSAKQSQKGFKKAPSIQVWFIQHKNYFVHPYDDVSLTSSLPSPNSSTRRLFSTEPASRCSSKKSCAPSSSSRTTGSRLRSTTTARARNASKTSSR